MCILFNSANPLLGIYHKGMLSVLQKGLTLRLFMLIYSSMTESPRQPQGVHLYSVQYYTVLYILKIIKNDVVTFIFY